MRRDPFSRVFAYSRDEFPMVAIVCAFRAGIDNQVIDARIANRVVRNLGDDLRRTFADGNSTVASKGGAGHRQREACRNRCKPQTHKNNPPKL